METSSRTAYTIKEYQIIFAPVDNLPPYTHKVIAVRDGHRVAQGWLHQEYSSNKKAAEYFYNTLILKREKPKLLEQARKKDRVAPFYTRAAFTTWLREHMFEAVGEVGSYRPTPIEEYEKAMEEAGKWTHGHFLHKGIYEARPWWMFRFKHFCQAQERRIYPQVTGAQALEMFEQADWDRAAYDYT